MAFYMNKEGMNYLSSGVYNELYLLHHDGHPDRGECALWLNDASEDHLLCLALGDGDPGVTKRRRRQRIGAL